MSVWPLQHKVVFSTCPPPLSLMSFIFFWSWKKPFFFFRFHLGKFQLIATITERRFVRHIDAGVSGKAEHTGTYGLCARKWLTKSFLHYFFERDAEAASVLQWNSLLQRLSAPASFVCRFVSQPKRIHMPSPCFSPCPISSKGKRQRSWNSISFVLENSVWTCACATHDIMAPRTGPRSPCIRLQLFILHFML